MRKTVAIAQRTAIMAPELYLYLYPYIHPFVSVIAVKVLYLPIVMPIAIYISVNWITKYKIGGVSDWFNMCIYVYVLYVRFDSIFEW